MSTRSPAADAGAHLSLHAAAVCVQVAGPLRGAVSGKTGLVVKNDFTFKSKDPKVSKVRNASLLPSLAGVVVLTSAPLSLTRTLPPSPECASLLLRTSPCDPPTHPLTHSPTGLVQY